MQAQETHVDVNGTLIVSIDGTAEFTLMTGNFCREYDDDALPLREWRQHCKSWLEELRYKFGARLRHIAVSSKYKYRQFRDPRWPANTPHWLDCLCVDDTYRQVVIEPQRNVERIIAKREIDATTAKEFMDVIRQTRKAVLIGVTTTSCIAATTKSLLQKMETGEMALQTLIMARDGVASRKSRKKDAMRILNWLGEQPRITMVPSLNDIKWEYTR